MLIEQTKFCSKCQLTLPVESFAKGNSTCRQCKAAYRRKYYEATRELEIERATKWRISNQDRRNEYKQGYREKIKNENPEAYKKYLESCQRNNLKATFGEAWEARKAFNELEAVLKEHPQVLAANPARRYQKGRRDSGYNREYARTRRHNKTTTTDGSNPSKRAMGNNPKDENGKD